MKHISQLLAVRKIQLEKSRQLSLFADANEKGSAEWSTFSPIQGDHVSAYSVTKPQKAIVFKESPSVLRIMYPERTLRGAH